MTYDLLYALTAFAFVSSITPGPNNLMLMTSGANFGFGRTIWHMLGVGFGFMFMLLMMGLGVGQVFDLFPVMHTVLKVLSAAYMLYLAYKIATSAPHIEKAEASGTPMTFLQACAFQWVNPKAWAMGIGAITIYAPPEMGFLGVIIVTAVFGAVNIPCVSLWAGLGVQMRRFLNTTGRLRIFNVTMAVLLIASLYPILK